MFAELIASFMALKEIASTLKMLVDEIKKLQQDQVNSALDSYKKDVGETIAKIQRLLSHARFNR